MEMSKNEAKENFGAGGSHGFAELTALGLFVLIQSHMVLAFCGCCNKCHKLEQLKTRETRSLTVLEARSLKPGLGQRYTPSGGSGGGSTLCFSNFRWLQHPLACGHIRPIWVLLPSHLLCIVPSSVCQISPVSLIRALVTARRAHRESPGQSCLKILK